MKSNDWLIGFLIGICLLVAEAGYLAHRTGLIRPAYLWAQSALLTKLAQ